MGRNSKFELSGINHLALVCKDMARTVDFYTNVLGMPLVKTASRSSGSRTRQRRRRAFRRPQSCRARAISRPRTDR